MEVLHEDNETRGRFYIASKDVPHATMTYVWAGENKIIIDHTEVDDVLRGKGAGRQMVMMAVDFARKNKITILPLCPFAKSIFDKTPEIRDVL